jgi:SOS-response transcriptional repressor LexA
VYSVKGFFVQTDFSRTIKQLRRILHLSQEQLARGLEVTKKTVAEWEQGRQPPSAERLLQLAKLAPPGDVRHWLTRHALGRIGAEAHLVLEALLDGRAVGPGPLPAGELRIVTADWSERLQALERLDHYVPVPLLRDPAAAGAPRAITEADIEGYALVHFGWCPDPSNFVCLRVRGDSMAPILHDGAIVGVDQTQRDPALLHQQLVAALVEGGVTIKWLERQPDGGLLLVPENKNFPTIVLPRTPENPILGMVAWYLNRPAATGESASSRSPGRGGIPQGEAD